VRSGDIKKRSSKRQKPKLVDERLVAAFSHETRAHAMGVLAVRPASTKELATELRQSVSAVWYHVNKLLELGCIELVESKKRRGAMEHFYRATVPHFFDDEAWASIPKKNRLAVTMGILRLISGDLDEAVKADALTADDNHLSRSLLNLDRQGWTEAAVLLNETLEHLLEIREHATLRMAESGERSLRASVSIMQFELPSRASS
jgi:predicted ArsR family transcriptional regulator